MKLQVECENSTCDLNGIQRDYSIVNEVISKSNDVDHPPPLPPERPIPQEDFHDKTKAITSTDEVPDPY